MRDNFSKTTIRLLRDRVSGFCSNPDCRRPTIGAAKGHSGIIIEGVAANPTSLGWVGFAYVEENLDAVKPVQVDGGGGCVARRHTAGDVIAGTRRDS